MFNPYDIAAAAGELAGNLADYLRQGLQPPAPSTEGVGEPYTPPFEGGQCPVVYAFDITFLVVATGERSAPVGGSVQAPIGNIETFEDRNGAAGIEVTGASGTAVYSFGSKDFYRDYQLSNLRRADGLPDNCGDLPNPNLPPSPAEDGLAQSPPPDLEDDRNLATGAPLVLLPSIAPLIAAAAAALGAAADLAGKAAALMDALAAIADALDRLAGKENDKEPEEDEKKSLFKHNYGSVRKDGFLRLYPNGEVEGFEPMYIDLQLLSIPIGYGKYFGKLSPNFYRFKSLGHISFVSASFGILETHEIEFTRTSLNVPRGAYGFYYHLGLEDVIRANVAMFYLKIV